jgi:ATP-dependent exoDNAse (exonuclease V) beta subunit
VNSLAAQIEKELQRRGVPASKLKSSANLVARALRDTLSDTRGRWILEPRPDARSEYRVRVPGAAGVRTYVIDRIFQDRDGTRWVVDFKTSRHEGADVDVFLDRERERYAPQLHAYAIAIERARAGIYFPLLRGWRQYS